MAAPFDSLAKNILDVMLHDLGQLETEVEVAAPTSQRVDARFVPDPSRDDERRALGLLGRMTERPSSIEAVRNAPSVAELREFVRKMLNHLHARSLARPDGAERMWLLCAGRPDAALKAFRATPSVGWPAGFYDLGDGLPLSIVVLSELEATDDTLALRLMGAGRTLVGALRALRARYEAMPRGRALFAAVVQVLLAAQRRGEPITEATMFDTSEAEEWMRRERAEGMREGMRLVRVVEGKLARTLTEPEWDALMQMIGDDGAASVGAALHALDADALARRLAPPRG